MSCDLIHHYYIIESVLCPWPKIVTILLLFQASENIQSESRKVPGYIFQFATVDEKIAQSKRTFLLQKFHTKVTIDGNGFFNISYTTLIGIGEAITIYMVYFIQFMSTSNIFVDSIPTMNDTLST